jgi:cyclopropane fatty-acyl-phospholipid synthase-like methyltransferase
MGATLLDLPGPLETARRMARERGLEARVEFVASDVRVFQRERSFDVVLISQLLHMLSPDEARDLLNRGRAMLVPGGRVIIQAQFLNDDRVSPRWPALLNLIEAVITPGGRNHTVAETSRWLAEAGFENVRHIPFAAWNPSSCLVGEVPEAPTSPSV